MEYALMHKNVVVALIDIDDSSGTIIRINEILNEKHLPVGTSYLRHHKTELHRDALNGWWSNRAIPASRKGIDEALNKLDMFSTTQLLTRCMGLSLSDHYWIKPSVSTVKWEDVNFFTNEFSDDIGDVLFGNPKKDIGFDYQSPDNTSNGNLIKRWKIIDGKRCLVKGGSAPYHQEPFGEAVATNIMKRFNICHIPYTVIWDKNKPYSVCEDFVTTETELVSALKVMTLRPKANHENEYAQLINICNEIGMPSFVDAIDKMLTIDFIVANEDRHFRNFGFIRNADTLEWIGFSPIFDSGSSLGYNKLPAQIISGEDLVCKPFKKTHIEQLQLVTSFDWLDISVLKNTIEDDIVSAFLGAEKYVDESRLEAIVTSVKDRVAYLERVMEHRYSFKKNDVLSDFEIGDDD